MLKIQQIRALCPPLAISTSRWCQPVSIRTIPTLCNVSFINQNSHFPSCIHSNASFPVKGNWNRDLHIRQHHISTYQQTKISSLSNSNNPLPHLLHFSRSLFTSQRLSLSDLGSRGTERRSRLVNRRNRPEQRRIKVKEVLVIDETGENIGEMATEMAFQIAEGRGLEVVQVQKESENSKAVCKFISKKQFYDEKKEQKQQSKKDPQQITKEIPVSTKIGPHDLDVKMNRVIQFLDKRYNVRVVIEATFRKYFSEAEINAEKKLQLRVLKQVEQKLEGVGSKVNKEKLQGKKLVCNFKPLASSETK